MPKSATRPVLFCFFLLAGLARCTTEASLPLSGTTVVASPANTSQTASAGQSPNCKTSHIMVGLGDWSLATNLFCQEEMRFIAGPRVTNDSHNSTGRGSHGFRITSGQYAGRIMIIKSSNFNGSRYTSIYNPADNSMLDGPDLPNKAWYGSHSIAINSGPNAGKTLVVLAAGTMNTALYNPATNTFAAGPVLSATADWGAHTFVVPSGTWAGRMIILHAYGASTTTLYDPLAGTMVAGPTTPNVINYNAASNEIKSGIYAGQVLILSGYWATFRFNPSTNTFAYGKNLSGGGGSGEGGQIIPIERGPDAGKLLVVHGDNSGRTSIYDPFADKMTVGQTLAANVCEGGHSIPVTAGPHAGKTLVVHGCSDAYTSLFDPATTSFTQGPETNVGLPSSSHAFQITWGPHAGKTLLVSTGIIGRTALFDPATSRFSLGPLLSARAGQGAFSFAIATGMHAGKSLVIHAGVSNTTSLYDPGSNAFTPGPNLPCNAGSGANGFLVKSGIAAGQTVVVCAGATNAWALFDPNSHTFSAVQTTLAANPTVGSHNFTLTSGPHAGKTVLFAGGNAWYFYDPALNAFSLGTPDLSTLAGRPGWGAHTYLIDSGPNAGKFVTVVAGNSTNTLHFDPVTATFVDGGIMYSLNNAFANDGSAVITITSGANSGKKLVTMGNGYGEGTLFDPSVSSGYFSLGPIPLDRTGGGSIAIPILYGSNAGKWVLTMGVSSSLTNIFDPISGQYSYFAPVGDLGGGAPTLRSFTIGF